MAIKVSGTEVISDDKRILNNESLPDIRPSLLLDFANSKTLDPRITFTRGSTATYWDGKTTAKAEENLYLNSQTLNSWGSGRLDKFADDTTAPDGTTTADRLQHQTGYTVHGYVVESQSATSGATYTQSGYFKAGTNRTFVAIYEKIADGTDNLTWFNLSSGTVGQTNALHTAAITDVGNGWYRCSITYTANGNRTDNTAFYVSETDGSSAVTDNQGFIYGWGLQFEQRSSATAYTPTTSSPIVKYQPVLQTAASGEARFDHDPLTGESKGLLIEEARTNLETNSVYSGNNNVIITTDATTAPDGTQTGILIQENTSNALHRGYGTSQLPAASTRYTFSVYIKNYEGSPNERYFYLNLGSTIGAALGVDLATMTINTMNGSGSPVSSIEEVGNGWYRLVLTGTSSASPTSNNVWYTFRTATGTGDQTYTGDGFSGFYIWGAQFEQGSFPTSYIPTSGSTVTRAVDAASLTGSNFSDWYTQGGNTVYVDFERITDISPAVYERIFTLSDGSASNRLYLYYEPNTSTGYTTLYNNGVRYSDYNLITFGTGNVKTSTSFDYNSLFTYVNGSSNTEDTSLIIPEFSKLNIGSSVSNTTSINSTIKKIAFYPKRLPNATLQAMTEE